jgi:hypothetical protein
MTRTTTTVTDESRPVTEGDLLHVERELRRWLIGILGAVMMGGVGFGAAYGALRRDVDGLQVRIEEVRVEGSLPLQQLRTDIAVIKEQQRANTVMLNAIAMKLRVESP